MWSYPTLGAKTNTRRRWGTRPDLERIRRKTFRRG